MWIVDGIIQDVFFSRFFSLARFTRASFFSKSAFDTVSTMRSALLIRWASVLPGTFGAGFIIGRDSGTTGRTGPRWGREDLVFSS